MKFASEGTMVAGIAAAVAVVAGLLFGAVVFGIAAALALGVLLFFRDPERQAPQDPAAVVSPADGRVVFAETGASPHRFAPGSTVKVAIFMSPLDVHVNRSPLAATVEKIEHKPGRFGAAYKSDADAINESSSMLLRTAAGAEVVVVQIAGFLARRIVNRMRPRAQLSRAERFGLIMFGSRVDVYLPPQARLAVRPGETVRAGQTTLAWLDATAGAIDEPKAA
ncbi:MAG TPA: phosphatidylserine decarboxylase [Candidatus Binatia bacterium]